MRAAALVVVVAVNLSLGAAAQAATNCSFRRGFRTWTLRASCTTDETIVIPVANLEGRGFTITAHDPPGGHFRGAIVRNGGPELNVAELRLTAEGLNPDACDADDDRLNGILIEDGGGSVTRSVIAGVKQGDSGCQEGNGIIVRNVDGAAFPFGAPRVEIEGNTVTGYQKTGIVVNGDVTARVTNNVVDSGGPVDFIARNGIQIGLGARATVAHNRVVGNSYSGSFGGAVGAGVLIVGGPPPGDPFTVGTDIEDNVILGADVGVFLDNEEEDASSASVPTRVDVRDNVIAHAEVTSGVPYSAGVLDIGNRDRIVGNLIFGAAYDPDTIPGSTFEIDVRFAIDPTVRRNR